MTDTPHDIDEHHVVYKGQLYGCIAVKRASAPAAARRNVRDGGVIHLCSGSVARAPTKIGLVQQCLVLDPELACKMD